MKIRRRTADAGKHARFTIIYEAVKCGKVVAKDYTKAGLRQKLKERSLQGAAAGESV